ncbi:MAG: hypothetical protein ACREJD_13185 [Phycisphaerales bacterium]
MAEKRTNTSFLIGLAVSAAAHIAALIGLQHVKIDATRARVSLASLKPMTGLPHQVRPQEQKPPVPDPLQPPPPPDQPKDLSKDVKFGIDDSLIDSNTWLGFLQGDSPSGRQGETDQAAMALDPGDPGTASPGSAGSPGAQPSPAAPESAASQASSRPPDLMNLRPPSPSQPDAAKPADDATPKKAEEAAPAPSRSAPPQAAPPVGQSGEKTTVDDPLAPRAGAEKSNEGARPDAPKPVETPKPDGVTEDKPEKPDAKEGVEREGEVRKTESEKMSAEDGKGQAEKEVKEVAESSPLAKPDETMPPVAVVPAAPTPPQEERQASEASPSSNASPSAPPTPATGGQSKQKGIRSDRESEAFSKKVIDSPNRDGRVQAGKGLNIITRRAEFTNTTLMTAPPRDTMVRISFQKSGTVKRAEFVNGSATGNPNVDDPLMNAIYRWRASGKDLNVLASEETLSVTVRVTFK